MTNKILMLSNCVSLCLIDRRLFEKGKDIKKWSFTSAMNLELIRKTIAVEDKYNSRIYNWRCVTGAVYRKIV